MQHKCKYALPSVFFYSLFAHDAKLCRLHRFYGRCVYTKAFRHPQMSTYSAEVRYSSSHKVVIRQVSMAEFPGFWARAPSIPNGVRTNQHPPSTFIILPNTIFFFVFRTATWVQFHSGFGLCALLREEFTPHVCFIIRQWRIIYIKLRSEDKTVKLLVFQKRSSLHSDTATLESELLMKYFHILQNILKYFFPF